MKHYFGTDGIRGVAGEPPLDAATVYAVGLALGDDLGPGARVVLGEDTRESSAAIAGTLASMPACCPPPASPSSPPATASRPG